jgi:hypothetical protein
MDGLAVEEGKVEGAGDDLGELKVDLDEASAIAAANSSKGAVMAKGGKGGKPGRHPVPLASCNGATPKADEKGKDEKGKAEKGKAEKGKDEKAKADKPAAPVPTKKKEAEPLID